MAAGDNFTLVPDSVIPDEPEYNTVVTPSESMKKEYLAISSTPVEKFTLNFKVLPSSDMLGIRTHYKDQTGGYYPFNWKTVPSYIASPSSMKGRWVAGSMSLGIVGDKYWSLSIKFEKSTT
ncbi:MAG: hypothetical protein ABH835_00110 [Patescibacteria group bacterium]